MAGKKSGSKILEVVSNFDDLPASAFVDRSVVQAVFDVSSATFWRWVESGVLPKPRRFSQAVLRWNVGELRAVLNGVKEAA